MNLQPIYPEKPIFTFYCRVCGQSTLSTRGIADLDGEAFKDYYCPSCAIRAGYLDEKDQAILAQRRKTWAEVKGPRVGDFIHMKDGTLRRFTHHWGDGLQTTVAANHPCANDESFYLGDGYTSFSGSLDPWVDLSQIKDTGELKDGRVWFFHHDHPTAHNGVRATIPCRVYRQI